MSLVSISAGDITEYHGTRTPAYARLYANEQFTTDDDYVVARGHKLLHKSFYQQFTASLVGSNIRIASGDAYSTVASNKPNASYTLVVYDANGKEIVTVYTNLRIPANTPTTWATLETYSAGAPETLNNTYLTADEIVDLFSNFVNSTVKASDTIIGVTKLTATPLDLNTPIAVGAQDSYYQGLVSDNYVKRTDYPWTGIIKTYYLESYGNNLATAVSNIGSTPCRLVISSAITVSIDLTCPSTMTLVKRGVGVITVASGKTLWVNSMEDPGNNQFFALASSTSRVYFGRGCVPHINVQWLCSSKTGATDAINAAIAAINAISGGIIHFTAGDWTSAGPHLYVANMLVTGEGQEATKHTQTNTGQALWKIGEGIHFMGMRDMSIDGASGAGTTGLLFTGSNTALASGGFEARSVRVTNFATGWGILATDVSKAWQCINITADKNCSTWFCDKNFDIDAANTNFKYHGYSWTEVGDKIGNVGLSGPLEFTGEFAGSLTGGSYGTQQAEGQTITAGCGTTGTASSVVTAAGAFGPHQSSGSLTVGHQYTIVTFGTGDVFTNVGAASNAAGVTFTASGTTPTTWTHSSVLYDNTVSVLVPLVIGDSTSTVASKYRLAFGENPYVGSFFHMAGSGADIILIALDPAANDTTMNFSIVANGTGITSSGGATSGNSQAGAVSTMAHGWTINGTHSPINFIGSIDEGFDYFLENTGNDPDSSINFIGANVQSKILLTQPCTINTIGCTLSDRVIRDGTAGQSLYTSTNDSIPLYVNQAGLGGLVAYSASRTNTIYSKGVLGHYVDNYRQNILSHFAYKILQVTANSTQSLLEPVVSILASVNFTKPLLRLGKAQDDGGQPVAYYDFWRQNAGGDATKPLGYLVLDGNQSDPYVGLAVNGPLVNRGTLNYNPSSGNGYMTGAGGAVTQITSSSTSVALNKPCGQITTVALTTAAGAEERFTVDNSLVAATDVISLSTTYNGAGTPMLSVCKVVSGHFDIVITNVHAANAFDAVMVINFAITKAVAS